MTSASNLLAVEQRASWTDERLDDLIESIRTGFARGDQDIRELRADSRHDSAALRTEMRAEFTSVRTEMRDGFVALRGEIESLRLILLRVGGGMMIALLGVIAAIIARGA